MGSPLIFPRLTIIDPSVQSSLPFNQTVNGALDATAHILEYYFSDDQAITTNAINTALLKTIMEMTDRLRQNSADLVARGNLAWCATLALNGLSGVGLKGGAWACHSIEHAFSALKPEIAHGEGLGVIFPAWIEYMSERMPTRFEGWAHEVWGEHNVSRALRKFRDKIRLLGRRHLAARPRPQRPRPARPPGTDHELPLHRPLSKLGRADIEALLMLAY
jgi:alcohol dehydrogenase YqhD (iron-dependent ADH family)